ncbi:hypothetical protein HDU76_001544, partial [Blyttiomyces sp. JEL0837]
MNNSFSAFSIPFLMGNCTQSVLFPEDMDNVDTDMDANNTAHMDTVNHTGVDQMNAVDSMDEQQQQHQQQQQPANGFLNNDLSGTRQDSRNLMGNSSTKFTMSVSSDSSSAHQLQQINRSNFHAPIHYGDNINVMNGSNGHISGLEGSISSSPVVVTRHQALD